jgi:histidinol-phosphate aminotransferase
MMREEARMAELLRQDVAALDPYTPIQPFEVLSKRLGLDPAQIVKLDANENPYGPVPAVAEALAEYGYYHIYPDPEQSELRTELAETLGVAVDSILATHGADEILDTLCRVFLEPGDAVVNCPPTFGMYRFDATINGAQVLDVWRSADDFAVDVGGIVDAIERDRVAAPNGAVAGKPKLLFLTSPNNPSGNWLPDDALARLLALPVMVVLDEAYVEFSDYESRVGLVEDHENLIVVRTFSKVAGLAGLRLGYAVCPQWLMPHLWKFKQPYNVNVAASVAGLASLRSRSEIDRRAKLIREERDRLYGLLSETPFLEPWPSEANFILCKVTGMPARELKETLERSGVMVRYYSSAGLEECIRISVGRPDQSDRLLAVLHGIGR